MRFFLIYLFLEIAVSVPVFSSLGVLGTFIEVIGSAFIGFLLLANSRYRESFSAVKNGNITLSMFHTLNIMTILGALLLIVPGVLTDILGILMQFGFASALISSKFIKKENSNIHEPRRENNEEIIDVEVIDYSDTK